MWHCADNSSYQGCPLPEKIEEIYNGNIGEDPYSGYDQDNAFPYDDVEWGQDSVGYNQENAFPSDEVEWGQDSAQPEFPKPVTDEAEFSDGWK